MMILFGWWYKLFDGIFCYEVILKLFDCVFLYRYLGYFKLRGGGGIYYF